jgi:rhodanese-related sulfurtransferase
MAIICYNQTHADNLKGEFTMSKKMLIVFVVALFTICTLSHVEAADKTPEQLVKESKSLIKEVSIDDVKKMIDTKENVIILDVTDKHEFEGGHIPGAINISRGTLEFKVAQIIPDKNSKIIVYCGIDLRGPLATRTLNDLGYNNAVNVAGGLKAWKAAGYPLAK